MIKLIIKSEVFNGRQVFVKPGLMGEHGDHAPVFVFRSMPGLSIQVKNATFRATDTCQQPQKRCFSSAIFTQKANDFTRLQAKFCAVEDFGFAKTLAKSANFKLHVGTQVFVLLAVCLHLKLWRVCSTPTPHPEPAIWTRARGS